MYQLGSCLASRMRVRKCKKGRLTRLSRELGRSQDQERHELKVKVAVHDIPICCAFHQLHLLSVLAKAHLWNPQRYFAKGRLTLQDGVETAQFSTQAYIGEYELKSRHTTRQEMLMKLVSRTV